MIPSRTVTLFVAMILLSAACGAVAQAPAQGRGAPAVSTPVPVASGAATLTDFSKIAEKIIPAVVNISSQQVVRRQMQVDPFFGSIFGRFSFRDFRFKESDLQP